MDTDDDLMTAAALRPPELGADGAGSLPGPDPSTVDDAPSPGPRRTGAGGAGRPSRESTARRRRNEMVEAHRDFAERYVRRYANRGVPREDLRQTALLALVQAADRFDPEMGVEFTAFAGRTIDGTVKRYFRDRTWWVRPPRSLQELHLQLRRADDELSQRLARRPSVAELAREVGEEVDRVLEALEASSAHGALSIDRPLTPDDDEQEHAWLGALDGGYGRTEARMVVGELLDGVDERLQEILRLRYAECLTQQEISDRMGISQSYLSRLIRHGLASMRASLRDTPGP